MKTSDHDLTKKVEQLQATINWLVSIVPNDVLLEQKGWVALSEGDEMFETHAYRLGQSYISKSEAKVLAWEIRKNFLVEG